MFLFQLISLYKFYIFNLIKILFISHIGTDIFSHLYPDLPLTGSTVTITHYYLFLYQGFLKMIQRKMCEIEIIAIPAYTLSILAVLPFK